LRRRAAQLAEPPHRDSMSRRGLLPGPRHPARTAIAIPNLLPAATIAAWG
jgi:hypothetical protein